MLSLTVVLIDSSMVKTMSWIIHFERFLVGPGYGWVNTIIWSGEGDTTSKNGGLAVAEPVKALCGPSRRGV
jgi:hypothetical protein